MENYENVLIKNYKDIIDSLEQEYRKEKVEERKLFLDGKLAAYKQILNAHILNKNDDSDWTDISGIYDILEAAKDYKFDWTRKFSLKYINIKVDMRDGGCLVTDRNDNIVNLNEMREYIK